MAREWHARQLRESGDLMAKTAGARSFGSMRKLKSDRWQIRYTDPNGISRTGRVTFTTKTLANRELDEIRLSIEKGTWSVDYQKQEGEANLKIQTLEQLAERWRAQATKGGRPLAPKTLAEYEGYVSSALKDLKDKPLTDLTTLVIESWRNQDLKRGKYAYTTKVFKHLKQLLTWAVKRGWIRSNPCDLIEGATTYKARESQTPSLEQVRLILANAEPPALKLQLALIALAGIRPGEIFELRRKDIRTEKSQAGEPVTRITISRAVSWVNSQAIIKATKNEETRTLPIREDLAELIQAQLKRLSLDPEALLFPAGADPYGHLRLSSYRKPWEKLRELAGYSGSFYTLRRFHLTEFARTGATLAEIQARGGHKSLEVSMFYQTTTGRDSELTSNLRQVL
jgi:integrase